MDPDIVETESAVKPTDRSAHLKDPDVLAALESLEDPEDREDLIDALEGLDKIEQEGTVPWQETKKRLGLWPCSILSELGPFEYTALEIVEDLAHDSHPHFSNS